MNTTPSEILQSSVDVYNTSGEEAHAKYPPSAAKRWCNCSASVKMSEGEDSAPNQYTAEGSLAHIICEITLSQDTITPTNIEELVGDTYMIDGFEIEVTEEMVEAVTLYAKTIVDDSIEFGLNITHVGTLIKVEQRINIVGECWGTSDCNMAVPFTKLIVYDFKYGAGVPVDVQDNYQMKCYAVGALNEYEQIVPVNPNKTTMLDTHRVSSMMDVIELVIVQPRARHKDGEVRRWETTREDLLCFKVFLEMQIEYCESENPKFKSGDWCRWCPAKHKCQHMFEKTQDIAKSAFDVIDDGSDTLTAMTDEQMIRVLDNKDTIIGFLNAVVAHAQARLETGGTIGDYKLVRGRATRKWVDEKLVVAAWQHKHLSIDALYTKKFVSPAQLEKVLKAEGLCKTAKIAKEYIADWVDPGVGKLSIAPGHDKREQVLLNAGEYFDSDSS